MKLLGDPPKAPKKPTKSNTGKASAKPKGKKGKVKEYDSSSAGSDKD